MVVYTMSKPEGRKKKSQLMDETNQQHETHESFTRVRLWQSAAIVQLLEEMETDGCF
jgi:hypothetical protein